MIEDLMKHLREKYPGVFLAVKHDCRAYADGRITTDWTFWHSGAGQHIGPCATVKDLLADIEAWEASGERFAAEEIHREQVESQQRLDRLTAERRRVQDETANETYLRAMPLDEALRDPDAFVESMTETSEVHDRLPPHLDPNRDLGDPVG